MNKPLSVLVAHNSYQMRGGEDAVVDAEVALLRAHGHQVIEYRRHNDELRDMRTLVAAINTLWSRKTSGDLDALVAQARPDIIHVHNTFPLISPSLYWAADRHAIPVVQTLHNFRLICPQAMLLRDGKVCEECVGHVPWRAVKYACYRDSRLQSMTLGSMLVLHRMFGTWQQRVTKFIALNDFCRRKFIEGGLPGERIVVKPNFVDFGAPAERERSGFLFVGRLSMEKGIEVLRNAAMLLTPAELVVVGSGPAEFLLTGIPGVELLGAHTKKEVGAQMSKTLALIFPSICFETFGLVIIEAFAHGTPVIASHLGVVTDLVEDGVTGLLFAPGNDTELAQKITWARSHPEEMAIMGRRARLKFEEYFTPDKNYDQLLAIYEEARLC